MARLLLNNTPVLVAEDQTFIALDLALAIEDAGGKVVGPAASVAAALELLDRVEVAAAILDVELEDGDCLPLVQALANRHIPMIIQTGAPLPPAFAARLPDLIVHTKPCASAQLVAQLGAMVERAALGASR